MYKLYNVFVTLVITVFSLSSCKKDTLWDSQKLEEMRAGEKQNTFSLEAEAEWEAPVYDDEEGLQDRDNFRALKHSLIPSKTGKQHPSIKLDYRKGTSVPVVVVIQNEKSGQRLIKSLNWKFSDEGKNLSLSRMDGGRFTDAIKIGDSDKDFWKMFTIMGGVYNEQDKIISFEIDQQRLPYKRNSNQNNTRLPIDPIYMPVDGWTPLSCFVGKNGNVEFKAKSKIRLRNVGSTFALTVTNQYARNWLHYFRFSVNNYSFAGKYSLGEFRVGEVPTFTPNAMSSFITVRPKDNFVVSRRQTLDGYYIVWGVPIDSEMSTIGGQVTLGALRRKDTGRQDGEVYHCKPVQKTFDISTNKIYGITITAVAPDPKGHPIEQFMADINGNIVTRYRENADINKAIRDANPTITVESSGNYTYNVPEQNEYRIIAPSTMGGAGGAPYRTSGERPIVEMYNTQPSFDAFTESIKAFGSEATYTSHVVNTGGINSYAIRFKGGSSNKYYSAYHYQKQNGRLKITVRVLGASRTHIGINEVSQPSWWASKPPTGVREIVRYVPNGTWMSSTEATENALVRHTLCVFPPEETASDGHKEDLVTRGVYTTKHALWGRYPELQQNKKFGTLLIADQQ